MNYKFQEKVNKYLLDLILSQYFNSSNKKIYFLMWPDIFVIQIELINQIIKNDSLDNLISNRLDIICKEPGTKKNKLLRLLKHKIFSLEKYKPINLIENNANISWLPDYIIDEYIDKEKLKIFKTRKDEWFHPISFDNFKNDFDQDLINLNNEFVNIFVTLCKKLELQCDSKLLDIIECLGTKLIYWFIKQYEYLRSKPKVKIFLSGTMGSPTNRLIADYVNENKGKVIVFDHGTSSGMWKNSSQANIENFMTNDFITFSPKMIKGLNLNFNNRTHIFTSNKVNITSSKMNIRKNYIIKKNKIFKSKYVYVAATFDSNFITNNLYNDNIQFKWLSRLFDIFKSLNLNLSIKLHPNTSKYNLDKIKLITNYEIYLEDLNNFNYEKNILIFDNPQSSSFRDACITNCKILLFNMPRINFFDHVLDDINKRCEIIDVVDKDDTFVIDRNKISESIKNIDIKNYQMDSLNSYFIH